MKGSIEYTLCRSGTSETYGDWDDDIDVTIDYTITPIIPARVSGPPEDCYPAEGGEVDNLKVTRADSGEDITGSLTGDEEDAICEYIQNNHDFDEGDPREDWDVPEGDAW
jgi:hypothetical protein